MVVCELCDGAAQSMFRVEDGAFDYFACGKHAIFVRKLLAEIFRGRPLQETLI